MYVWEERAKYVPEESGVYAFYDEQKVLIYVGKSLNLRQEFANYLNTNFSNDPCKGKTRFYKREFTSRYEERLVELLDECQKEFDGFPECNDSSKLQKRGTVELGFHFYEGIDRPLHNTASNLQDLKEKMKTVPEASLEFHQERGDFAKWIRDVIADIQLSEDVQKISATGENLRKELLSSLSKLEKVECPKCGNETGPAKTWTMAGRPSKIGERNQLTIAFYRCSKCGKTFRQVIAKEKIRDS